jgi:hypothetical protein
MGMIPTNLNKHNIKYVKQKLRRHEAYRYDLEC